ncbi:AaceriAAL109Wp [[Ashbya] aceris (nom. inval.)]|nr:AaceriAAL109Wp [[Ashbya] aceris (nom. inval.)]
MVKVGDRVKVRGLVGVVRYLGETKFAAGQWVGIELDEAVGKNDGSVQGVNYFRPSKRGGLYGLFARVETVVAVADGLPRSRLPKPLKTPSVDGGSRTGSPGPNSVASIATGRPRSRTTPSRQSGSSAGSQENGTPLRVSASPRSSVPPPLLSGSPVLLPPLEETKLQKVVEKLQEKLYRLHLECKELKRRLEEQAQSEKVETLVRDVEALTIAKVSLEEEKEELAQRLAALEADYGTVVGELGQYREEVELRRKIDLEEASRDDVGPDVLWKQNELMKDALLQLEGSLEATNQLVLTLQEEKIQLVEDNGLLLKNIEELKNQLSDAQLTIDDLVAQVDAEGNVSNIVESLTTQNLALTEQIDQLNKQLNEVSSKNEVTAELEQVYKEVERELLQQIHSLQQKVEEDELMISRLTEKNDELEFLLESNQPTSLDGSIVDDLRNTIVILENDKCRLRLDAEFLHEKIRARKPDPLKEYTYQLNYLAMLVGDNPSYEETPTIEIRITLIYLSAVCETVAGLYSMKSLEEDSVDYIIDAIPLDKWITRYQNGQNLNIDRYQGWLKLLDAHPLLETSANLVYGTFLRLCVDVTPALLAILKGSLSTQEIQDIYGCFQTIEKIILGIIKENDLGERLMSFKTLEVRPTLSQLFVIVDKLLQNNAAETIVTELHELQKTMAEAELELVETPSDVNSEKSLDDLPPEEHTPPEVMIRLHKYEEMLQEKETVIEELMLKVRVLDIKNEKTKEHENTIMSLRGELDELKEKNHSLLKKSEELQKTSALLEERIQKERANRYTLISTKGYSELLEEKLKMEKLDLISEISDLRKVIRSLERVETPDSLSWLKEPLTMPKLRSPPVRTKVNELLNVLQISVKKSEVLPISGPQHEWQPKHKIAKYHLSTLIEREALIKRMTNNIYT